MIKLLLLVVLGIFVDTRNTVTVQISEFDVEQRWQSLSKQLNQINQLIIVQNKLSQKSFIKVLSQDLPKLKKLGFSKQDQRKIAQLPEPSVLTHKIVKTIFTSKYFSTLQELDLSKTNIDDRFFSFLDQGLNLTTSIQVLKLNELYMGKKGFQQLAKINFKGQIKQLSVKDTLLIQLQAIDALLDIICDYDSNKICKSSLQGLDLQKAQITRDGFIKLITTINNTSIKSLRLGSSYLHYNKSYRDGFNFTAYQTFSTIKFPNLKLLSLKESGLNDQIADILSNLHAPNLSDLAISVNPISDEGIKKLINKRKLPLLQSLAVYQTDITDATMQYIKGEKFQFKNFNFGKTKVTEKGVAHFQQMNLERLQKIILADLYLPPKVVYGLLKSITSKNLSLIIIKNMKDLNQLMSIDAWQNFKNLQTLVITKTNIQDSYQSLITINKLLLPELLEIYLDGTNMNQQTANSLIYSFPVLFPRLQYIRMIEPQTVLFVSLRKLYTAKFSVGTYINLGYIELQKGINKLQVITVLVPSLSFFDDTGDSVLSTISSFDQYIKLLLQRVTFQTLEHIVYMKADQLTAANMIFGASKIKIFRNLYTVGFGFQLNIQDFLTMIDEKAYQYIRFGIFKLSVPGDVQNTFLDDKIIPFMKSFQNINILNLQLTFLSQEYGPKQKQKLMKQLYYPCLTTFFSQQQELIVDDLKYFIKNHSSTLHRLNVDGNFLETGFIEILTQNQIILDVLNMGEIFFTVEQFAKLGHLSTEHLRYLQLSKNDLTNQHILSLLRNKKSGPYFPKLQRLIIDQNNIGQAGLEALLSTQMHNLFGIIIERNNIPSFLNLLLQYPNKVTVIVADKIQVYSLNSNIYPQSVFQVQTLAMKTYSFTEEDFDVLGKLRFSNLQKSGLYLNNIYNCSVLKNLLSINKNPELIINNFRNDKTGFNSSCLTNYSNYYSKATVISINDQYGTTYLPEYIQLIAKTTRDIQVLKLQKTRLPPASLKKILSNKFHSLRQLTLQHNYLDDDTFQIFLTGTLDHLQAIYLKSTLITSKSVINLSNKKLPKLQLLDLSQNQLDSTAIQALSNIAKTITHLSLSGCNLAGDSLNVLKTISFPNLVEIHLSYNYFTQDNLVQFLIDWENTIIPKLSAVSLKGVSLSKQKYELVEKILQGKQITQYQMDRPYNVARKNAANY